MDGLDPITFEVVRAALAEATEEMALTMRRTAYSTNIKTRADFSCAFFDAELRAVAQAFTQPVHLGSLTELVPRAIHAYGPERLGPGDALLTNDPYAGGVHLNDITLISPVFHNHDLLGYVACLAHHVDVGGGAPASIGAFQEVYQEGVIIPPVRLVRAGTIVDDILRLVLAQIRSTRETSGDLRAKIAANTSGTRRLAEIAIRVGPATLRQAIDELLAYTNRRARAELARLPHGIFRAVCTLDGDGYGGPPVRLAVAVIIDAGGVRFDLTGCDPQRRAPVNSTFAQTFSACAYALKCLIDGDIPVNQGYYDLVHVQAPLGTVVNCQAPAPVVGGWETQMRLTDLIFRALAPALPALAPAGTKGMICHAGFGGPASDGSDYFCFLETLAGGYGARAERDGPDAVQPHGQNTENAPIEETEANYPVRILRYELVNDSDGPGRRRGGLGLRRDYTFPDRAVTFTILADRDREGPWGLFGGQPGQHAEYWLVRDTIARRLDAKTTLDLQPGDIISYRTCGGGGYGPPNEREPALVLRDVQDGKISPVRARSIYRVALDPITGTVDPTETAHLRAHHQPEVAHDPPSQVKE